MCIRDREYVGVLRGPRMFRIVPLKDLSCHRSVPSLSDDITHVHDGRVLPSAGAYPLSMRGLTPSRGVPDHLLSPSCGTGASRRRPTSSPAGGRSPASCLSGRRGAPTRAGHHDLPVSYTHLTLP